MLDKHFQPGKLCILPAESHSPAALLAAVGDYRLVLDLQAEPPAGMLGVRLFHRLNRAELLGIPRPIPAKPDSELPAEHCGLPLTLGPSYKESDGAWMPLAAVPSAWADIAHERMEESPQRVEFEVEYRIGGGPTLWERYRLQPDGLFYETRIRWVVGGFRLQMPVFLTNGVQTLVPRLDRHRFQAGLGGLGGLGGQALNVEADDETVHWEAEPLQYANSLGVYQNILLQSRSAVRFGVHLSID